MTDKTITRDDADSFAKREYTKLERNRDYALNRARLVMAGLARAILDARIANGRSGSDEPRADKEFATIITKLSDAGCNVLQPKPADKRGIPKPWIDPCTGQHLPPPAGPDEEAILERRDPALLAHYRAMAKAPYATVAKILDEESDRQLISQIVYTAEEHKGNVFATGASLDEKAAFVRRNPVLAKRYQEEAREVEVPIVGQGKNMTIVGALSKDPAVAAIIKAAEQNVHNWREADRAAAEEQARAAQQKLDEAKRQLAAA